jgi:hypothetical protein
MATENVNPLSETRINAATAASYEVQLLTEMLLPFIENEDEEGRISVVARSTLKRISNLCDCVTSSLDPDTTAEHLVEMKEVIYGRKGVSLER